MASIGHKGSHIVKLVGLQQQKGIESYKILGSVTDEAYLLVLELVKIEYIFRLCGLIAIGLYLNVTKGGIYAGPISGVGGKLSGIEN